MFLNDNIVGLWPKARHEPGNNYEEDTLTIVFVWLRNGANWTKAFVKVLLAPEFNIVGGAVC